jgi:Holliday junction resolvasome RuvABC endonuclease subunit
MTKNRTDIATIRDLSDLDLFNPSYSASVDPIPEPSPHSFETITVINSGSTTRVLAFDQAIANTGWVLIQFVPGVATEILAAGTIHTTTEGDKVSWDDTLDRASRLFAEVSDLIWNLQPDLVLHEMPPVGSGPFIRGSYSSVTAAVAIRNAAMLQKRPVDHVSANAVKKNLTGNGNAKKKEVRAAVESLIADGVVFVNPGASLRLNEHIVDAIGIALTHNGAQS